MTARSRPALCLTACVTWAGACDADTPGPPPSTAMVPSAATPTAQPGASLSSAPASKDPRTPNELFARGTPTFVVGTLGDDHEDQVIRGQAELIRSMLFKGARVVADTSIDVTGGPAAWPPNPVLYGGPQHNAVLAALAAELPFKMTADSLEIDGRTISGAGTRFIGVLPAHSGALSYPAFCLYAGTGREGVAEINGMPHGENGIAIYDAFDSIAAGGWQIGSAGRLAPRLNWAPARAQLVDESFDLRFSAGPAKVTISTVAGASYEGLAAKKAAVTRGLETAFQALKTNGSTEVRVVIYPNKESKKAFTHSAGDGHAVPAARTLHVVAFDEKPFERLIAHEATHIYTHQLWTPPGSPFMGEGFAVWVSGQYGGVELARWKDQLAKRTPLATLLGAEFRRLPESETYPQAGLVIGAIIDRFGVAILRDRLWFVTPDNWQAACDRLGIKVADLEKATR